MITRIKDINSKIIVKLTPTLHLDRGSLLVLYRKVYFTGKSYKII